MKINIYQINLDRDTKGVAFEAYSRLQELQGFPNVKVALYDRVYSGTVAAEDLEDVFCIFNADRPEDYKARSMSVSDVVKVIDGTETAKPGFYYCDTIGFKKLDSSVNRDDMIQAICYGMDSLYHPASGMLVITDLVDGAGREKEEDGIRAGNGDWLYGVMTCHIPPDKAESLRTEYGSLTEYALGCIPAPGTFCPNRMDFEAINSTEDVVAIVDALLSEHPDGWVIDQNGWI